MSLLLHGLLSVATFLLLPLAPCAQAATAGELTPAHTRRVVERLATLIEQRYPDPAIALSTASALRGRLERQDYDTIRSASSLAGRLCEELRPIDPHFTVGWTAPGAVTVADPMHDPARRDEGIRQARRSGFGFRRVELLPGNVGLIKIDMFHDTSYAGATAVAALGLVAGADALILDLRDNGGGEPTMVQLLASYLFEAEEPVALTGIVRREADQAVFESRETLAFGPGPRMPTVPVWVLISRRTGSAAEALAYDLQSAGRATIVGERSAGGANPGQDFDLGDGFSVFVSTAHTRNPITGANWQGSGVHPDVPVAAPQALALARELALAALAPTATDELHKLEIAWAQEELAAAQEPRLASPEELGAFAGLYGDRRIWLESGRRFYQRADRSPRELQPLGADRFLQPGVEGFRTRFERDASGSVVRLVDAWVVGHEEAFLRR